MAPPEAHLGRSMREMVPHIAAKDEAGLVFAVNIIVEKITDRNVAEAQRELLLRELNQRVKNTLAVVQSIAEQAVTNGISTTDFDAILMARLRALSRTHKLLARAGWQGASLADVFEQMLAPFLPTPGSTGSGDHIWLAGPDGLEIGPPGRGFGTWLIEKRLVTQFAADVSLTFVPSGAPCRISLPANRVLA